MKQNKFTYSGGFRETCTSLLKTFDKCLMELNSVVSGKTTAPDEYAVCNAEYKFRYISPDNIAEFASNLMKVIVGDMISTRVADVEKFSVESATRFVGENDCDPFNWTTIMATGNYPSNSMTLNDLLVYCQNEFFAHTVLSKYEMDERRNLISKDFKTLSGLHISSNIGKIIDKLPTLMEKTDLVKFMNDTQQDVVMAFIEQFIKFAISLNISTVVSMINFCVPRSTYNTALQSHKAEVNSNSLLDDEYFKESVDLSTHKPVYVILTDTKTPQSTPVKIFTKSKVCHASISMDSKFNHCYTFTQVHHGLTIEDFTAEKNKKMDAEIYVAYVTNENYDTMKKYCETMEENKWFTKYNWKPIGGLLIGKDLAAPDDLKQICSSFVNNVFKTIGAVVSDKITPTQEDIKKYVNVRPDSFSKIYAGSLRNLSEPEIISKSKDFASSKSSKVVSEYESGYFNESVDESNHKPVYVILTDTKTPQSGPIKFITKSSVCHASFSLYPRFNHCYSFGMTQNRLITEDMTSEKFKVMDAEVYVAYVTNENYDTMKKYIETLEKHKDQTRYNWGAIRNMLFKIDKEYKDDLKQVCSSFVNNVFKSIGTSLTNPGVKTPSPEGIKQFVSLKPDQFSKIYTGSLRNLSESEIIANSKGFAKSKTSRTISEYVTECCLLKTNDINFNNKLPFNINMRNIVLQDMHPNFKDTVSAINFLLKDNRSPFSQLIYKYGSLQIKHKIDPDTIVRMFIGNPCCKFDNFSNYTEIYNRLDFHSDVNWLDKITYGDVYQASNYRRDALGNDNKHPIQVSLEMLYQMYCPCKCKTNEDLADHIQCVGKAMIGIANIYKECGIENWELVRDILAVMGEIMTKCMIRLYNNHMAVIVAADAMDDTIVPGYMYNEYFLMEADDANNTNKPTVTNAENNANDVNSDNVKSKISQYAAKSKDSLRKLIQQFTGWVNDKLAKAPMNFISNHKAELDWVKNHDTLNKQVTSAIQSNRFNPHIENWPLYNVPAKALIDGNKKLSNVIANLESTPDQISLENVKKNFYGLFKDDGLDMEGMLNLKPHKGAKTRDNTTEQNALTNWVLYSNSKPQQTTTNQLTPEKWNDLIGNIQKVGPALTQIGKAMSSDISKCLDSINKRLNSVKEQDSETKTKTETESYEDTNTYGDLFMEDGEEKLTQQQLQTLFNAVQDISDVWCVGIQNALDKNFYRTSYTLYKDMIAAYKQSNGNTTNDQSNNNKTTEGEPPAAKADESASKTPTENNQQNAGQ